MRLSETAVLKSVECANLFAGGIEKKKVGVGIAVII
jgi:hypothetical protein